MPFIVIPFSKLAVRREFLDLINYKTGSSLRGTKQPQTVQIM
jgi:hypothetical protein